MRVRRVIDTQRTVVFRLTIEEISGFLAKLLYVLLRTSCSPGWDAAAPVRHLDARLSGFWPRACALGPADWSGWQPAQVKERHGCPRHRRSHFGRCVRILPNSIDAMQPVDAEKWPCRHAITPVCDYSADEIQTAAQSAAEQLERI